MFQSRLQSPANLKPSLGPGLRSSATLSKLARSPSSKGSPQTSGTVQGQRLDGEKQESLASKSPPQLGLRRYEVIEEGHSDPQAFDQFNGRRNPAGYTVHGVIEECGHDWSYH